MIKYLDRLPEEIKGLIALAGRVAQKKYACAYLVGGFVRDLLLGVKNLDVDILVEGGGIALAEEFCKSIKPTKLIRHKRFGTATVIIKPHLKIDFSTARKECYPYPASLPDVSPGCLKDDLFRRDFTINAMAINITGKDFGKLIDLYGGKADLAAKRIRILHDLSFIDDPTRILRAVRFKERYNFRFDPRTLSLLKESAKLGMLKKVQPQRIRDDLILILKEDKPIAEIEELNKISGLDFIGHGLKLDSGKIKLMRSVEKQISWFNESFPKHRKLDSWLIYFMCLSEGLDLSEIKKICTKLTLRKGEEKRMLSFKEVPKEFIAKLSSRNSKPSLIASLLEPLSYEVIVILRAKFSNPVLRKHIADFFKIYNGVRINISGDDLAALGLKPGPDYQRVFARVLDAKLDGEVASKQDELVLIEKMLKSRRG